MDTAILWHIYSAARMHLEFYHTAAHPAPPNHVQVLGNFLPHRKADMLCYRCRFHKPPSNPQIDSSVTQTRDFDFDGQTEQGGSWQEFGTTEGAGETRSIGSLIRGKPS